MRTERPRSATRSRATDAATRSVGATRWPSWWSCKATIRRGSMRCRRALPTARRRTRCERSATSTCRSFRGSSRRAGSGGTDPALTRLPSAANANAIGDDPSRRRPEAVLYRHRPIIFLDKGRKALLKGLERKWRKGFGLVPGPARCALFRPVGGRTFPARAATGKVAAGLKAPRDLSPFRGLPKGPFAGINEAYCAESSSLPRTGSSVR